MVGFQWRDNFDMIMGSLDYQNDSLDHFNQIMGFCDYCPSIFLKLSNNFLTFAKNQVNIKSCLCYVTKKSLISCIGIHYLN